MLALFNLALSALIIIGVPIMAVNFLGMSDAGLGAVQGAIGLGGLAGGLPGGILGKKLNLRGGPGALGILLF